MSDSASGMPIQAANLPPIVIYLIETGNSGDTPSYPDQSQILLVETLTNELQCFRDTGTPIGPVMGAIPYPVFVRNPFFDQGNVQQSISFSKKIVVSAVDPIPYFFQFRSRLHFN